MVEDWQLANAPCVNTQSVVSTVVLTTSDVSHTQPVVTSVILTTTDDVPVR